MEIKTTRITIRKLEAGLAKSVHLYSLDDDNRRFVPDEVFETVQDAKNAIDFLIACYSNSEGPFVYAIYESGLHIGHVQVAKVEQGWEVGYHIAKEFTGRGYATEALKAFVPMVMQKLATNHLYGICDTENYASQRVLEKSGFKLCSNRLARCSKKNQLIYELVQF
ncbi:GNAT family N-acetyltransferase [Vibrio sp. WXL103]|uniref:GNAT family N-acetyltransferase n=1 Tax=Vibrio sp. WXL103 TaxID=3450710 RepID=UPI003EC7DD64